MEQTDVDFSLYFHDDEPNNVELNWWWKANYSNLKKLKNSELLELLKMPKINNSLEGLIRHILTIRKVKL